MNLWPVLEWLVDEQPVAAAREAANHSRREWHSGLSEKDSSLNAADTVNSLVSPCFLFLLVHLCVCTGLCAYDPYCQAAMHRQHSKGEIFQATTITSLFFKASSQVWLVFSAVSKAGGGGPEPILH